MAETLSLEGRLDLSAVSALRERLLRCTAGDITVDLSGVTLMGALCLQCLVCAGRSAGAAGHRLKVVNVPEQVRAQCALMGLDLEAIEKGAL